jgi:hypothetical protein
MANPSKTIAQRLPKNPNSNSAAFSGLPIVLKEQEEEKARAALEEHRKHPVPHQPPDAPSHMHRARMEWIDRKYYLQTALDMAIAARKNSWVTVGVASEVDV